MSYILDALKKAESEREQGGVPGLHSQPMTPAPDGDDDDDKARGRTQPVVWVGAGVALCLIAVLSWKLISRDEAAPQAVATATVPQAEHGATTGTEPGAANGPDTSMPNQRFGGQPGLAAPPPPQQATQPPAAQQSPQPPLTPMANQAPPAGTGMPATRPAQPHADMPQQPPQRPATASPSGNPAATATPLQDSARANTSQAAGGTPASPAQGGQRVPGIQELPEEVRREIPQITVGGAMYSEIPSQRMLIINSQVFREGDQPYQGLVLEEIRLKSAVFKYRGYRYSVNY